MAEPDPPADLVTTADAPPTVDAVPAEAAAPSASEPVANDAPPPAEPEPERPKTPVAVEEIAQPEVPPVEVKTEADSVPPSTEAPITEIKKEPEDPTDARKKSKEGDVVKNEEGSMDIKIKAAEMDEKLSKTDDTGFGLFGEEEKKETAAAPLLRPTESSVSVAPSTISTADVTEETPKTEDDKAVFEKQPAIGQLELRQLLSSTSMKIVEHAQKLAEAPLIGTLKDIVTVATPSPASPGISPGMMGTSPGGTSGGQTVTVAGIPLPSGGPRTSESNRLQGVVPSRQMSVNAGEDKFPGPDYQDQMQRVMPSTVVIQEDDFGDQEPYEAYTIPDGMGNATDVPAVLRNYIQMYNDERQPIAKMFRLEDEDKLNEAATWDIQNTYEMKPTCMIRCSVLEKILMGILQYRLSKYGTDMQFASKNSRELMPVLNEDIASTLSQLKFPSYKYDYFVTLVAKNRQDVVISTRQLWDPETDRRVIAKYETQAFHSSVIVHFVFHP